MYTSCLFTYTSFCLQKSAECLPKPAAPVLPKSHLADFLPTFFFSYRYHCELCDFSCINPNSIRKHRIYKHINIDKYKCDICAKTFNMKHAFDKHKKAEHLGELPFLCNKCDFKAKTAWTLNLHKKKVHLGVTSEVCEICGKDFANIYNLRAHIGKDILQ